MNKEVVLLEYVDGSLKELSDYFVLGLFTKQNVEKNIEFYNTLPGFSRGTGEFIYKTTINTNKHVLYLLQITKNDYDITVCEKIFETKELAKNYLKHFIKSYDKNSYNYYIEKYIVNEKMWTEGFIKDKIDETGDSPVS